MMRTIFLLIAAMLYAASGAGPVHAQVTANPYATLAAQPDLRDFAGRADSRLTILGDPKRFVGYDVGALSRGAPGSPLVLPTAYEVRDVLATVQALGGTVVRTAPLLLPSGAPDQAALATLNLVLGIARDLGLKVIVPLFGAELPPGTFTAPAARAHLAATVKAAIVLVNPLSALSYRDDPTILAWENCVACGQGAEESDLAAWAEQLGQVLKGADPHHLYESGVFAGRIGPAAVQPVPAASFATPSVDIVGDILGTGSDPFQARLRLNAAAELVAGAARIYVIDSLAWTAAVWKTPADLDAWISAMARQRNLAGAVVPWLVGHANAGGYRPAPPSQPALGAAALYFPGIRSADMDALDMQARGRALRRFAFAMLDINMLPAFLLPPQPVIISAAHGRVDWRGAAGAARYSVERSSDPSSPNSWQAVCDACTDDVAGFWQDPSPPSGNAWYRVMPFNINGHKSVPSEPVRALR